LLEKGMKRSRRRAAAAPEADPGAPGLALDEPLATTAPIARKMAEVLCHGERGSPQDCAWFHGIWQYLRLFNLVSTPQRHARFFLDSLGALARDGGYRRLLVSGAADYSLLAHALRAYRRQGAETELSVVDLCRTPLFLCQWYADQVSAAVDTTAADILAFAPGETWDVICTHSFLARFSPAQRGHLVAKWRELLRPGGRVVTTTRINPAGSPEGVGFTAAQVAAFRKRVFEEARRRRAALGIDAEEMAALAQRYAERLVTHSVRSREEISDLFEAGGFRCERLDLSEVPGAGASQSGPSTRQRATYAEIVAVRL